MLQQKNDEESKEKEQIDGKRQFILQAHTFFIRRCGKLFERLHDHE